MGYEINKVRAKRSSKMYLKTRSQMPYKGRLETVINRKMDLILSFYYHACCITCTDFVHCNRDDKTMLLSSEPSFVFLLVEGKLH